MAAALGLIGAGNMGYAILSGLIEKEVLRPDTIAVYDSFEGARERAGKAGCAVFSSEEELVLNSQVVLAAVKPQVAPTVFRTIGPAMEGKLLLSIVAGIDTETIRTYLGNPNVRILRIMPNTPAMVGEGVFGLNGSCDASAEEKEMVEGYFSRLGMTVWVPEHLFPVITSLSGGGPAFVAMFTEALADGGVLGGLKREDAIRIAAQTVLGSARLLLEKQLHPAVLKDMVCSPAGTTIEGVGVLEDGGFRGNVIRAVEAAALKATQL